MRFGQCGSDCSSFGRAAEERGAKNIRSSPVVGWPIRDPTMVAGRGFSCGGDEVSLVGGQTESRSRG